MMTNPNARTRLIHGVTCLLAIVATLTWVGCVETLPAPSDGDPVDNANDNVVDNANANDNVSDNANANANANANDNVSDNANDNDSGDQDGDVTYADPDNHHIVVFDQVLMKSYDGTEDCLTCHRDQAETLLESGHWLWEGESAMLEGAETETHGKRDLINNFCIAIPSNEGRCTQCHAGYGWSDDTFDFTDQEAADCLVCHDTTATYDKAPTTAGLPVEGLDLDYVAKQVGKPTRESCGNCHYNAGGGDNVKHGDLPSTLAETTRDHDVHMGVDGLNFRCQACHTTKNHQIAGMPIHSQDEGRVACTDCHDEDDLHSDLPVLNAHLDAVACQSCHIPAIARTVPTKVYWDWSTAGQDIDPIPTDDYGKALYDKKKGTFEWGMDVKPELHWFNGKWQRVVIGNTPHFERTDEPVVLADPVGDINDSTAKLYPFKKMTGKTPADPVNRIMLVPHLFGTGPGENPFWGAYDWALALAEGAAYAGQDYSGTYEFVDTVMYLTVNHEIPPASEALGCTDCHSGGIDFVALGYEGDPWEDTGR